jgi:3,4-dihydroxy 2-butanone 4-phosphate synthase/GTP cyclohydrolase II
MTLSDESSPIRCTDFEEVLSRYAAGEAVVLLDDLDRENEGDVVFAAEKVTPELIIFLMREARGLICVSVAEEIAKRLELPFQVEANNSPFRTPFAVSVDAVDVLPSGVTASARAKTIRKLIEPNANPADFATPGHVFPLIANKAGVFGRNGHTEGVFDLSRLTGLAPAGVLCEVLNSDGSMARGAQLRAFADTHSLAITTIQEIQRYRGLHETSVRLVSKSVIDSTCGECAVFLFADDAGHKEHVAVVYGDLASVPTSYAPLVRIHSECVTGDVFGSRRCDCGPQLEAALGMISQEGVGVILYLRQEGRGIGLGNKLKAYALQEAGHDTVEANVALGFQPDERDFAVGAHMLQALGLSAIRLITNNPRKISAMKRYGISVVDRVAVCTPPDPHNAHYLATKRDKLGHLLAPRAIE